MRLLNRAAARPELARAAGGERTDFSHAKFARSCAKLGSFPCTEPGGHHERTSSAAAAPASGQPDARHQSVAARAAGNLGANQATTTRRLQPGQARQRDHLGPGLVPDVGAERVLRGRHAGGDAGQISARTSCRTLAGGGMRSRASTPRRRAARPWPRRRGPPRARRWCPRPPGAGRGLRVRRMVRTTGSGNGRSTTTTKG